MGSVIQARECPILTGVNRSRVKLPKGVRPPFDVYLNGVLQRSGDDYDVNARTGELVFGRPLAQEGRLGPWRWFLGAWGIGTYRKNDVVDVRYERNGQMLVAHALEVKPPSVSPREGGPGAPTGEEA